MTSTRCLAAAPFLIALALIGVALGACANGDSSSSGDDGGGSDDGGLDSAALDSTAHDVGTHDASGLDGSSETGDDSSAPDSASDTSVADAGEAGDDGGTGEAGVDAGDAMDDSPVADGSGDAATDAASADAGDAGTQDAGDAGASDAARDAANDGGVVCSLKINEVQTGTGASASDEWVEVYNSCGTATGDLAGWKLEYESATGTSPITYYTWPAGSSIAAGGFYLIVGSAYSGTGTADGTLSSGLKNTGGGVAVVSPSSVVADSVGWGVGTTNGFVEGTPAAAPGDTTPPHSIIRLPDGTDNNLNQTDFRVTTTPTPRAANR